MPSWADPVLSVGIIVLVGLVAPVLVLLIGKALAGSEHPMKRKRFESGNPPVGSGKGFFSMQYYPYLIMFVLAEPYAVFLFIVAMTFNLKPDVSGSLMILGVLALALALRRARKMVEG